MRGKWEKGKFSDNMPQIVVSCQVKSQKEKRERFHNETLWLPRACSGMVGEIELFSEQQSCQFLTASSRF
jgi:hypothetical protein